MKITQAKLREIHSNEYMTCWLPSEEFKLKEGMLISLKGVDYDVWRIEYLYSTQDHYDINRKWNVGGIK